MALRSKLKMVEGLLAQREITYSNAVTADLNVVTED